jgi:hypothetical protein
MMKQKQVLCHQWHGSTKELARKSAVKGHCRPATFSKLGQFTSICLFELLRFYALFQNNKETMVTRLCAAYFKTMKDIE